MCQYFGVCEVVFFEGIRQHGHPAVGQAAIEQRPLVVNSLSKGNNRSSLPGRLDVDAAERQGAEDVAYQVTSGRSFLPNHPLPDRLIELGIGHATIPRHIERTYNSRASPSSATVLSTLAGASASARGLSQRA